MLALKIISAIIAIKSLFLLIIYKFYKASVFIFKKVIKAIIIVARHDNLMKFGSKQIVLHLRKLSQNSDFSQDFSGWILVLESLRNVLYSKELASWPLLCFNNSSKAATSNHCQKFIFTLNIRPNGFKLYHLFALVWNQSRFIIKINLLWAKSSTFIFQFYFWKMNCHILTVFSHFGHVFLIEIF